MQCKEREREREREREGRFSWCVPKFFCVYTRDPVPRVELFRASVVFVVCSFYRFLHSSLILYIPCNVEAPHTGFSPRAFSFLFFSPFFSFFSSFIRLPIRTSGARLILPDQRTFALSLSLSLSVYVSFFISLAFSSGFSSIVVFDATTAYTIAQGAEVSAARKLRWLRESERDLFAVEVNRYDAMPANDERASPAAAALLLRCSLLLCSLIALGSLLSRAGDSCC